MMAMERGAVMMKLYDGMMLQEQEVEINRNINHWS